METREFLRWIWEDTDGYVYVPTKSITHGWELNYFPWPSGIDDVIGHINLSDQQGKEVYYGPAIYNEGLLKNGPKKANIKGSHVVWVDMDGNAPDEPEKTFDIPYPSARISSSTKEHQHMYWKLTEFCTDMAMLENVNRGLTFELNADVSGWDCTQVLRPVGTHNFKLSNKPRPVALLDRVPAQYDLDAMPRKDLDEQRKILEQNLLGKTVPTLSVALARNTFTQQMMEVFQLTSEDFTSGKVKDRSGKLLYLCFEMYDAGFSVPDMYVILEDIAKRLGKYTETAKRLDGNIRDILVRVIRKKGDQPQFTGLIGSQPLLRTYGQICAVDGKVEWIYEGVIRKAGFGYLAGPPGAGKTIFSLQFSRAVAQGEDFLGWRNVVAEPMNVLYLSFEMDDYPLKLFLEKMRLHDTLPQRAELDRRMFFGPTGTSYIIDDPKSKLMESIYTMVRKSHAQVVVIDSLSKITDSDINNSEPAKRIVGILNKLIRDTGVTIVVIHHSKKDTKDTRGFEIQDSLYGNRFLSTDSEFNLFLRKSENKITLSPGKFRLSAPIPQTEITLDPTDLSLSIFTGIGLAKGGVKNAVIDGIERGIASRKRRAGNPESDVDGAEF